MRYFIKLSFFGENYHGWQIQKNARTVQEVLNNAIGKILKKEIKTFGCCRTDTGVHAKKFFAHFDIDTEIINVDAFINKLNSFLPYDIAIYDIFRVKNKANARFDAYERTYKYYVTHKKNPFLYKRAFFFYKKFDYEKMNLAAQKFIGEKDFTAFSKTKTQVKNNICNVKKAIWQEQGNGTFVFTITSNRFLRGMVRAIVGSLFEIAKNKSISSREAEDIIENKIKSLDKNKVVYYAEPYALYLFDIKYPNDIYL